MAGTQMWRTGSGPAISKDDPLRKGIEGGVMKSASEPNGRIRTDILQSPGFGESDEVMFLQAGMGLKSEVIH